MDEIRCRNCSGPCEEARWHFATPVCFACLPPPRPLPIAHLKSCADRSHAGPCRPPPPDGHAPEPAVRSHESPSLEGRSEVSES